MTSSKRPHYKKTTAQRLDDLRQLVGLTLTDIAPKTPAALAKKPATKPDLIARDALIQHLAAIGLTAAQIARADRAKYPSIPWSRVLALRRFLGKPDRLLDFEAVWRGRMRVVPALLDGLWRGPTGTVRGIRNPYYIDLRRSSKRDAMADLGLDTRPQAGALFRALRRALPKLESLFNYASHRRYEDPIYRFYHQSGTLFDLQRETLRIVEALQKLAPKRPLNERFMQIIKRGTGRRFVQKVTAPMVGAFFHARYFLEMAVRYGKELKEPPQLLPSGWAAVLYLFNLR